MPTHLARRRSGHGLQAHIAYSVVKQGSITLAFEITRMLASGLECELDALANKDLRYLTKTYLPRKLKEEVWLD